MSTRIFPILDGPAIPWGCIAPHEQQANRNHNQTLERLAERGGLSCSEAVAVLEDRRWHMMPLDKARARLMALVGWLSPKQAEEKDVALDAAEKALFWAQLGWDRCNNTCVDAAPCTRCRIDTALAKVRAAREER